MKLFKILILFVLFSSCDKDSETITPNNEVLTSLPKLFETTVNEKEYKQYQFNYNKDFTKLESFIVNIDPKTNEEINTTFEVDTKGTITGITVDNYNFKFSYTDKNITKAIITSEGETIEEREIIYANNKISQIRLFEFIDGVKEKTPYDIYELTYIGENLAKFIVINPEFGNKKITLFEGKTYDEDVFSPTLGLGAYNQAITIGLIDEFSFLPTLNFQCFMSKNNIKTAMQTAGLFGLTFALLFNDELDIAKLTDAQINEYLVPYNYTVASKFNSSNLFPTNNLFSFKLNEKNETASINISYNEKMEEKK